jgi:hypothetical protein
MKSVECLFSYIISLLEDFAKSHPVYTQQIYEKAPLKMFNGAKK